MPNQFETEMRAHLESVESPTASQRRLLRVMDLPESNPRRKRVMAHAKSAAMTELRQEGAVGAID